MKKNVIEKFFFGHMGVSYGVKSDPLRKSSKLSIFRGGFAQNDEN
jgi:hypothetical protein